MQVGSERGARHARATGECAPGGILLFGISLQSIDVNFVAQLNKNSWHFSF